MRAALVTLVLLPLFAGCGQPAGTLEGPEGFQADYAIREGLIIRVRFGEITAYRAGDGSFQEGYLLTVNYSAPGALVGRDEAVLDRDLQPVRIAHCRDWIGGRCTRTSYEWPRPDDRFSDVPVFLDLPGWDVDAAPPGTTFDGKVAPASFEWQRDSIAHRTSYKGLGPLPDLSNPPPSPLPRAEPGPLLPDADAGLPGLGFSLQAAVDFAKGEKPELAKMLDSGGCLDTFSLALSEEKEGTADGVIATDEVESRFAMRFRNATTSLGVNVEHGRKAPFGERTFLGASTTYGTTAVDCLDRPPTTSLAGLLTLLGLVVPEHKLPVTADWKHGDEGWSFEVTASAENAFIVLDGTRGGLAFASDQGDVIDPAR